MPVSNFYIFSCDQCSYEDNDFGMDDLDYDAAVEQYEQRGYEDRDSGWWCSSCIEREAEEKRIKEKSKNMKKKQKAAAKKEWKDYDDGVDVMDPYFSVFNCHVNRAYDKARELFIRIHGREKWEVEIQPYDDEGMMSIFNSEPTEDMKFFVFMVTAFANEDKLTLEDKKFDGPEVDLE